MNSRLLVAGCLVEEMSEMWMKMPPAKKSFAITDVDLMITLTFTQRHASKFRERGCNYQFCGV